MRFQPGQSGNPAGRPKGCRDKANQFLDYLKDNGQPILEKMVERANSGDRQIQMFLADRFVGKIPMDALLPKIKLSGSLTEKMGQLNGYLEDGVLSSKEYKDLVSSLECEANILKVTEFEGRLDELEKKV